MSKIDERSRFLTLATTTLLLSLTFSVFPVSWNLNTAIVWAQTEDDREAEADRLLELCEEQLQASQYEVAIKSCEQALEIYREIGDRNRESTALQYIGLAYQELEEYSQAIQFLRQAEDTFVPESSESSPSSRAAIEIVGWEPLGSLIDIRESIVGCFIALGEYAKAIEYLEKSLEIYKEQTQYREPENRTYLLQNLLHLGQTYIGLGNYTKAIEYLQEGLELARAQENRQGELEALSALGSARVLLGDATGLEDLQQSLDMAIELVDRAIDLDRSERFLGVNLGNIFRTPYQNLSNSDWAENQNHESKILNDLGLAYQNLGEPEQAIDFFQKALDLYTQLGKPISQAEVLNNLGTLYANLGQYSKALDLFGKARIIFEENNRRFGIATTLNNLGLLYRELGQFDRAREFYDRALLIYKDMGHRGGEADNLHNIGLAYNDDRKYEIALVFYQRALDIWEETGNLSRQATAWNNIGLVQSKLWQFESALQSLEESISILRSLNNRSKEGNVLDSLGTVYRQAKQDDRSLAAYEEALTVLRATGSRSTEQVTLSNMGQLFEEQGNSELAIVFYKQSVNIIEEIRQDLRTLPREQQQSYTETVADTYRNLADLLLNNDRILEAQRVLDLLKIQELDDYLHNVRGNDNTTQGLPNLPAERDAWESYQKILDEAVEIGKELAQLQQKETLTPAETQRLTELSNVQETLREAFSNFTRSPEVLALVTQRSPETLSQDLLLRMGDFNGLQDNLRNLEQNAVLLYPLILDDRLELILTTGTSPPIRRPVPVSKAELNAAIAAFRSALQTPGSDAKTPAQQLYNWLIKPLENDLKATNAETIIYAPDGQLRYIPLAALHDGETWLVQRYRINNITATSLTDLNTQPQPQLNVLAGAFATGYYSFTIGEETYNFAGLPFAGVEVETLAQTVPATTQLIDTDFTPAVVPQFNRYNTVHLATHGAFVVGTPDDSFILFGNGERATLRDIATWGLTNVDLVVLSACETGLGGNLGNGEEILGLGYQIQEAGARAAIASLWIVDDGGTQILMNGFYAGLQREMTKAEALRQAQIALITGDYTAVGGERGAIEIVPLLDSLPRQVTSGLSHPYYWAPFILIGNGL